MSLKDPVSLVTSQDDQQPQTSSVFTLWSVRYRNTVIRMPGLQYSQYGPPHWPSSARQGDAGGGWRSFRGHSGSFVSSEQKGGQPDTSLLGTSQLGQKLEIWNVDFILFNLRSKCLTYRKVLVFLVQK